MNTTINLNDFKYTLNDTIFNKDVICTTERELYIFCDKMSSVNAPYKFYSLLIIIAFICFALSHYMDNDNKHKPMLRVFGQLLLLAYLFIIWIYYD